MIACAFAGDRIGADRAFFPKQGSRIFQSEQVIRRGKKVVAKFGQDCIQRLLAGGRKGETAAKPFLKSGRKDFGLVIQNCRSL